MAAIDASGGKTVLVVDDDDSLRMLCRINLELEGYSVVEASSIERAQEVLAAGPVDAILLDLHVGQGDGRQLIASLGTSRPPVALFTGFTAFATRALASEDWRAWVALDGDRLVGAMWLHTVHRVPVPGKQRPDRVPDQRLRGTRASQRRTGWVDVGSRHGVVPTGGVLGRDRLADGAFAPVLRPGCGSTRPDEPLVIELEPDLTSRALAPAQGIEERVELPLGLVELARGHRRPRCPHPRTGSRGRLEARAAQRDRP